MIRGFEKEERLTLSACMIVKNEERSLPVCLRSIRDHVDEIVIVDTGSTDNTVSIAESFGARVFHHPWENHFSKHRNQSFSYAVGDWILVIDADEEIPPGSGEALRQAICTGNEIDAIAVIVECPFGDKGTTACNTSIRVIRNHRGIHYRGRVHNYLVGVTRAVHAPARIIHHGYALDRETQVRRFRRTTELLKKDIEEDPFDPRPHHFLAASYLSEGMHREAASEAEEAVRLFEERRMETHDLLWSFYIASCSYLEMGDLEKAKTLATRGIEVHPDHLDSQYLLAIIAFRHKDHEAFQTLMARYLETRDLVMKDPFRFGEMVHNTFASSWLLHLLRASLLMDQGEGETAREALECAKADAPDPYAYHSTLGKLSLQSGRYAQALEAFNKALQLRQEDAALMWALSYACERMGRTGDQILWLERLLARDPEFPNAHFQAGLAWMRMGRYEKSLEFFQRASALDPKNDLAKVNEALSLRGLARYEDSLRLTQGLTPSSPEAVLTLLLNSAHCHYALGHVEQAIPCFEEIARRQRQALEPPVYLSELLMRKGEIEACVAQCDRLLEILELPRKITLHSLSDLGNLYFQVAHHLSHPIGREDLAGICRKISVLLDFTIS